MESNKGFFRGSCGDGIEQMTMVGNEVRYGGSGCNRFFFANTLSGKKQTFGQIYVLNQKHQKNTDARE